MKFQFMDFTSYQIWFIIIACFFIVVAFIVGFHRGYIAIIALIKKRARYKFTATIFINNYQISGDNLMTKVPLNAASVEIAFGSPVDAQQNPAKVQDGSLLIESTDDSILTVGPSDVTPGNPYSVKVSFTGKAGAAQVTIKADADLGEGVKTIEGAETFEVSAGEAVGFGPAVIGEFTPRS